jgi:hypothetical protein
LDMVGLLLIPHQHPTITTPIIRTLGEWAWECGGGRVSIMAVASTVGSKGGSALSKGRGWLATALSPVTRKGGALAPPLES